ncbi:MAG: hypothetical protein A2V98_25035 [Planctomycetes bacterium RBG_16_64_12]|nr:MAG: hypothetical protein A2V98_25035 [Planctomycetes bacterium RBG_16_64_12]
MQVTVFYAWQDDRPGKSNRYLIRDAAKEACRRITEDPANDYAVALDEATRGVPGMCDIPNTILEKIQACDVLLADLTFVGKTDANKDKDDDVKLISNPNVLFELGYGVDAKGFDRILGVMNVAYGEPERQMFDVKRRWAITYSLRENSDKPEMQAARSRLSKEIENALLTILEKAVSPEKGEKAWERFQRIRSEFESSVREGSFHGLSHRSGAIAITLVPDIAQTFDHSRLQGCPVLPPGGMADRSQPRGKSRVSIFETADPSDARGLQIRCGVAEITLEGVILAADTFCLDPRMHSSQESAQLGTIIPSHAFEREIIESVVRYGAALRSLEASLPWRLGVSLLRVRGYRMYAGISAFIRGLPREIDHADDLVADPILIRNPEDVSDEQAVGRLLKDAFDYVWRECGFENSMNYDAEGNWRR